MVRNRHLSDSKPERRELSPEQREHLEENRFREEEPIDNRKTDGPNTPST